MLTLLPWDSGSASFMVRTLLLVCRALKDGTNHSVIMIPVVDIGCYIRAVEKAEDAGAAAVWDSAEGKETAQQLHDAFCRYGFCYLSNHGVPHTVVSACFLLFGSPTLLLLVDS